MRSIEKTDLSTLSLVFEPDLSYGGEWSKTGIAYVSRPKYIYLARDGDDGRL